MLPGIARCHARSRRSTPSPGSQAQRPALRRRSQGVSAGTFDTGIAPFALAVRTGGDPAVMVVANRRAVNEAGGGRATVGDRRDSTLEAPILARFRFTALLLTAVAVAALVLAIKCFYGAITTNGPTRRQEIAGIRVALGALPGAIASLIARQGLLLTAAGVALGSAVAWAGTRLLSALLYGIGPTDPATMVGAIVLLGPVAIVACAIPVLSGCPSRRSADGHQKGTTLAPTSISPSTLGHEGAPPDPPGTSRCPVCAARPRNM